MKGIHWTLPFEALDGTRYRIDIYSDNAPAVPVVLSGASSPFTTDEDSSDDYFSPVRGQTGAIHILNTDGLLTLQELLPANNIDRPVMVRKLDSLGRRGAVVWQGFLNSETYTQEYNSRPHEIDLNVNSVLEALDSVEMPKDITYWSKALRYVVGVALVEPDKDVGFRMVRDVYMDFNSRNIFDKYIDYTKFLEEKQQDNENSVSWEIKSISCKSAIEYVCTLMGYVCREVGRDIYLLTNEDNMVVRQDVYDFTNGTGETHILSRQKGMMSNLEYRGTQHSISTTSGAKSVEVVAKIDKYELDLSIPTCPVGTLHEEYEFMYRDYIYALLNTNDSYYEGKNEYAYYKCRLQPQFGRASEYAETTREDVFNNLVIVAKKNSPAYLNSIGGTGASQIFRAGAMLAKIAFDDGGQEYHDTQDGLYLSLFPGMVPDGVNTPDFDATQVEPIYTMHTLLPVKYRGGFLAINGSALRIGAMDTGSPIWGDHGTAGAREPFGGHEDRSPEAMFVKLRIGNKYWNGLAWVDQEAAFILDFDENGNFNKSVFKEEYQNESGYVIPLPKEEIMQGEVWFGIYPNEGYIKEPVGTFGYGRYDSEMFFTQLEINYNVGNEPKRSDRGENTYFRLLGFNFKEEVSVNTELATDLNNLPSPSLILDTNHGYYGSQSIRYEPEPMIYAIKRPEHRLLSMLAQYYSEPRSRISLEVKSTDTPLPMVRLTGYDGKTYVPLSESRDWKTCISNITFFETTD